jgi:hypothetical protein
MNRFFPLTPGFSPVMAGKENQNRFNGFFRAGKPLKRLARPSALTTRLKPGVNEKPWFRRFFCGLKK